MVFYNLKDHIQKYKIIFGINNEKPITGPYSVHIDLTNHCNSDCISCWSFSPLVGFKTMDKETRKRVLSYQLVIKLIDDLNDMGVRDIYFTGGGEPFMHPHAVEIMEHVKSKGMRCDMSTNFTLITRKIAQRLVKAKIDHINCSLWAGTPEAYDKTHPNKTGKTFKKINKTLLYLKKIKKNKPEITLYNVISTKNYDDFDNMVKFVFKVKADAVEFTPTDIVPGLTDSLMLNKKQSDWLAEKLRNIWPKLDYWEKKYDHKIVFKSYDLFLRRLSSAEKGFYDRTIIGKIPCYAGFNFLRVLATGEVNSCLKSGRIPIGNIYEKSIKEIWDSKKQNIFRKHTINYDINNKYFNNIGNTTQKGNGCLYCCDNLGWNLIFHSEINKTNPLKKTFIKLSKLI